MRKLVKSMVGFSWAMTALGARTVARLATPWRAGESAAAGLDELARAASGQLDGPLETVYETADRLQSRVVDGVADALAGGERKPAGRFDAETFVVLGDGLAAGMGHFSLVASAQATSFPALLAQSLGTRFEQPLLQPPGLGDVIGLEARAPIVPDLGQTTVRDPLPSRSHLGNLSVPGLAVRDALRRRPRSPLIDRDSSDRTLLNLILGLPELMVSASGKTQLEYARDRRPTLALVALGYDEVLRAAVAGDPASLGSAAAFRADYERLLRGLGPGPAILAATVPDPLASAYFSSRETAAEILKTTPEFLERHYGLRGDDLVPLPGLYEMGYQMMARRVRSLGGCPVIDAGTAGALRRAVADRNDAIRDAAGRGGAEVFDLCRLLERIAADGVEVGGRKLSADYLGGLYLLNGSYPGATLNAIIAGALVRTIHRLWGQAFAEPAVEEIAAADANTLTELAPGPPASDGFLKPRTLDELPPMAPLAPGQRPFPIQTTYPDLQPDKEGCTPLAGMPGEGIDDPSYDGLALEARPITPLRLPETLEQTLEINPERSCFGDALRAVDCPGEPPIVPGFPPFGLCHNVFFGGLMATTSPLEGKIHVRFSPPDERNVTRFEIRHPGDLVGADGDLAAPLLFRMPSHFTRVVDVPEFVSSGKLDLTTGRVTDFHYNVRNFPNTALQTLLHLNPEVGIRSAALFFPGPANGGASWARFDPRPDGGLDVSIAGHMIVPMGLRSGDRPLRFALPFTTPDLQAASFVARGTQLHPRIFVTTRGSSEAPGGAPAVRSRSPEIPFNTVQEFTAHTRNTCFGDAFGLHAEELGEGGAVGRSQLLARVLVQFGPKTGDTAPLVLRVLPPGGLLSDTPLRPPFLPPGTARAAAGFDADLRFPEQTYPQSGVSSPDDPFVFAAASIDLRTGELVSPLLWRGFVVQALFAALVGVEPCTPSAAFNYQGPGRFERGANGQLVLRWNGSVYIPYPAGFKFPSPGPGGRPPYVIAADSRLDPFRRMRAVGRAPAAAGGVMRGRRDRVVSSTDRVFSYRYDLPRDPRRAGAARFEYTDHARGGTFRLTALSWIDFSHSLGSTAPAGRGDTVTFTGFGTWSADSGDALHFVSAQISDAPHAPYVGIQIDGGVTSNADTKPRDAEPA